MLDTVVAGGEARACVDVQAVSCEDARVADFQCEEEEGLVLVDHDGLASAAQ